MIEEARLSKDYITSGGIIIYPTDTIWGIGCDATNSESVERIFKIKQRSDNKSMLVLVNGISMLETYLESVPIQAQKILDSARKPTTIIYPGARNLASNLLGDDGSVGIRITSDPFCKELIEQSGKPIVSTSANISGALSPALFSQIEKEILEKVDYVVNWRQEETEPTSPSAIIKLSKQGNILVLRP
jgi:L-threonylcarbamoyladenylate synthase